MTSGSLELTAWRNGSAVFRRPVKIAKGPSYFSSSLPALGTLLCLREQGYVSSDVLRQDELIADRPAPQFLWAVAPPVNVHPPDEESDDNGRPHQPAAPAQVAPYWDLRLGLANVEIPCGNLSSGNVI